MVPNTFGITKTDIQSVVANLSIESDTSPTESQVNDLIEQAAAEMALEADAVGISLSGLTDPTQSIWLLFKRAIIYRVAADVLVARNRGNVDSAAYYIQRHEQILENIRKYPDRVASRTEDQGPNRVKYLNYTEIQDNEEFAFSTAGRIIIGRSL